MQVGQSPLPIWGRAGKSSFILAAQHRRGKSGGSMEARGCACIGWGARRVSAGTCLGARRVTRNRQDTYPHDAGVGVVVVRVTPRRPVVHHQLTASSNKLLGLPLPAWYPRRKRGQIQGMAGGTSVVEQAGEGDTDAPSSPKYGVQYLLGFVSHLSPDI